MGCCSSRPLPDQSPTGPNHVEDGGASELDKASPIGKASLGQRIMEAKKRLSLAAGMPQAALSKGCKPLGRLSSLPLAELPRRQGSPATDSLYNVVPDDGIDKSYPLVTESSWKSMGSAVLESEDEGVQWTSVLVPDNRIPGTWLVNQYLILQFLGKGVSGRVFLVMDIRTQRLYALKSMRRKVVSATKRAGFATHHEGKRSLSGSSSRDAWEEEASSVSSLRVRGGGAGSSEGSEDGSSPAAPGNSYRVLEMPRGGSPERRWGGDDPPPVPRAGSPELRSPGKPQPATSVREIRIMARLQHPNLPRLYEVIDDPAHPRILLIMTLAEGGCVMSRSDLEEERRVQEPYARRIIAGVAHGLRELHRAGIVHGDIKPENVLQGSSIWLSDFGCSYMVKEGPPTKRSRGTPAFLAPELLNSTVSTRESDVYALGATLFALVYGRIPFKAGSLADLYEALANTPVQLPEYPLISSELKQLFFGCLQKDPSRRYTLSQVLRHAWMRQSDAKEEEARSLEKLIKAAGAGTVQLLQPHTAVPLPKIKGVPALILVLKGSVELRWHKEHRTPAAMDVPLTSAIEPKNLAQHSVPSGGASFQDESEGPSDSPLVGSTRPPSLDGSDDVMPPKEPGGVPTKILDMGPKWQEERRAEKISASSLAGAQSVPEALEPETPKLLQTGGPRDPPELLEGVRRAKQKLVDLARADGGWGIAKRNEGELLGTSLLLLTAKRSFLGVTKNLLAGLYVASGSEEARIAILPGSKIADAWDKDELVLWMLQRLAWREETELIALQGLLVLAKPHKPASLKNDIEPQQF